MTVADLITILEAMPPDSEVNVDDGEFWPLKSIRESRPAGIVILEYMVRD